MLLQSAFARTFRVYIDPGHYKGNGASRVNKNTGELVHEEDVALAVGLKLRGLLENSGIPPPHHVAFDVRMSRDTDYSRRSDVADGLNLDDPVHRALDANDFGADLFISIHCNTGGGDGTETFWCDEGGDPDGSKHFADLVQEYMAGHGEWVSRHGDIGKLDNTYATFQRRFSKFGGHIPILLYLQVPGCLSEIGFLDRQDNLDKLVSPYWQHRFAEAYRDAIFAFFDLEMSKYLSLSLKSGAANVISWPGISVGNEGVFVNSRQFPAGRSLWRWDPVKKEYAQVSRIVFGEEYLLHVPRSAEEEEDLDISFFPRTALASGFTMIGSVNGNASFSDVLSAGPCGDIDPGLWVWDNDRFVRSQGTVVKRGGEHVVQVFSPVETAVPAVAGAPSVVPLPAETQLLANFPNPFDPNAWILFRLEETESVTLSIPAISGHLVRTIPLGHLVSETYATRDIAVYWNGRNECGTLVSSGIYFCTLATQHTSFTRKMLLLK